MITRLVLGAVGVLVGAYGAWLLLSRQDLDQLLDAAIWLGAGVVLHDFVLTPLVLLVGLGLARLVPRDLRPAVIAGAVVLGSVTLLAVPVLGRFGAKPDNPTLLDRDYLAGWVWLAALVVVGVVVTWLVVRSRHLRRHRPSGAPGRSGG